MLEKIKTAFFGNRAVEKLGPSSEEFANINAAQFSVHMPGQPNMEKSKVAPGFYKPEPEKTLSTIK